MLPSFPHLTLLLGLPHLLTAPPCLRLWKKAALALVTALEVALPPAAQSPDNRLPASPNKCAVASGSVVAAARKEINGFCDRFPHSTAGKAQLKKAQLKKA